MDIKMIIFVLIKICSIIQLTNAQGNYFWPLQWLKKSQHKFFQKTQSSSFYFFSLNATLHTLMETFVTVSVQSEIAVRNISF